MPRRPGYRFGLESFYLLPCSTPGGVGYGWNIIMAGGWVNRGMRQLTCERIERRFKRGICRETAIPLSFRDINTVGDTIYCLFGLTLYVGSLPSIRSILFHFAFDRLSFTLNCPFSGRERTNSLPRPAPSLEAFRSPPRCRASFRLTVRPMPLPAARVCVESAR